MPVDVKKCYNLHVLDLEGNYFTGQIPLFLSELRGLKMLSLGGMVALK